VKNVDNVYFGDWAEENYQGEVGREAMLKDFEIQEDALVGAEILFAAYTYENYSGDAFVLFAKDGELYEVHSDHCSCYGLEGQWEPKKTMAEAVRLRLESKGYGIENVFKIQINDALRTDILPPPVLEGEAN